jgi:hypothetical protein
MDILLTQCYNTRVPDNHQNLLSHPLYKDGVYVYEVLTAPQVDSWHRKILEIMKTWPEYKKNTDSLMVLGGFAALGNVSSFHDPVLTKLRKKYAHASFKILKEYCEQIKIPPFIEVLIDRLGYRKMGLKPTAESFHRDIAQSPNIKPNDSIFGGWLNLENKPQHFSVCCGTHLDITVYDVKNNPRGFGTVPKDKIEHYKNMKTTFVVPSGSAVIFHQQIVHEVISKKAKQDKLRLFQGYRLTNAPGLLYTSYEKSIEDMGIFCLPCGDSPRMYAYNHGSFFLTRKFLGIEGGTVGWSERTFVPQLITTNTRCKNCKKKKCTECTCNYNFSCEHCVQLKYRIVKNPMPAFKGLQLSSSLKWLQVGKTFTFKDIVTLIGARDRNKKIWAIRTDPVLSKFFNYQYKYSSKDGASL